MSSNPDDPSNNPFAEGGTSSSSSSSEGRPAQSSSGTWFCHQCTSELQQNDVLFTPEATCPRCQGTFLEKIEESIDDPRQYDGPGFPIPDGLANPYAVFGAPPGFPGGPGQAPVPGPFNALLHQLFAGVAGAQQHQQQQQDQQQQPVNPAQAAAEAAERRARGGTATDDGGPRSPNPEAAPAGTQGPRGGVFRMPGGGATFVWSSASSIPNRPPPRNSTPSQQEQPHQPQSSASSAPQSPQEPHQQQNNVPIRNLASFLTEAFGGTHHAQPAQQTQQPSTRQSTTQPQPSQEEAQPGGQHAQTDDILTSMLRSLAGGMGLPIGQQPRPQESQTQQQSTPQAQEGSNAQQQQQQPQANQGQRPGATRIIFGNPAGNGGVAFTFTTGGGVPAPPGMMPFPFPFGAMFGGGEEGGMPGRLGDYVFSQGALDNIITELMNQANGRYGPQPAPEEMINNLPKVKMTKELLSSVSIQDCAVCKDDFQEEDEALKLPCNHIFHQDCIKPWLERSGTCPVCRYQLVEQPEPPRNPNTADQQQPPNPSNPASAPISPGLARSPPIEGGSSMPGAFPFNLFGFGRSSNTETSGDRSSQAPAQQGAQGQNSDRSRPHEQPQGQPDMDLDLD